MPTASIAGQPGRRCAGCFVVEHLTAPHRAGRMAAACVAGAPMDASDNGDWCFPHLWYSATPGEGMTPLDWTSFVIGAMGTVASVGRVTFAIYERRKRLSLERKVQSPQWATLDRARYVIGDHVLFKEFEEQLTHPLRHRLWNLHQAASDLYITLVEQYLAGQERFTYDDPRVPSQLARTPTERCERRTLNAAPSACRTDDLSTARSRLDTGAGT